MTSLETIAGIEPSKSVHENQHCEVEDSNTDPAIKFLSAVVGEIAGSCQQELHEIQQERENKEIRRLIEEVNQDIREQIEETRVQIGEVRREQQEMQRNFEMTREQIEEIRHKQQETREQIEEVKQEIRRKFEKVDQQIEEIRCKQEEMMSNFRQDNSGFSQTPQAPVSASSSKNSVCSWLYSSFSPTSSKNLEAKKESKRL